ncbi:transcription factor bHLH53-like [Mangifera indica]|uniref:transcription factor bHLH53-like n=1 Tax=Mangifera indica TaxID=29780 RepID=UPI001CFBF5D9|nr:transcription factor bHLH53-like [Mangifera indica]
MALSFWDNGFSFQHYFNQEMLSFHPTEAENNNNNNNKNDVLDLDSYFSLFSFSNNDGYGFDYDYVSDYFPSPLSDNFIFPVEDIELYQNYPKRQKSCYYGDGVDVDHHDSVAFLPEFFSGCVSNVVPPPPPPPPLPEFRPDIPAPPLAGFSVGKNSATTDQHHKSSTRKPNGGSLKAQSIVAGERRRKIKEKTQELGKLIPGSHRLNTAEMFQSASKYVKFLQAQLKLLQFMQPIMVEKEEKFLSQELQTLLKSPVIQEKLYSEEKCLVPRKILQTLRKDPEIQSKPAIFGSIYELLETSNG